MPVPIKYSGGTKMGTVMAVSLIVIGLVILGLLVWIVKVIMKDKRQEPVQDITKAIIEGIETKNRDMMKAIAAEVLETERKRLSEANAEKVGDILNPFKEKIEAFGKKVEEIYKEENTERVTLQAEIKHLMDLNKQVSDDTLSLTNALKGDSKFQGDWGELQLERLLEKSGLIKGVDFVMRESHIAEDGNRQIPDCIVNLPDDKKIVIDSKVSLTACQEFFKEKEVARQERFIKENLASVIKHIDELKAKDYHALHDINTPDYVLMYVPLEAALGLAVKERVDIFEYAIGKNILLVTGSTLLATLKTISFMWKQEKQKKNVLEIARQGAALYEKFVDFHADMISVGDSIKKASDSHGKAMDKLKDGKGNLISKVEALKKLGLKVKKNLPEDSVKAALENDDDTVLGQVEKE